MTEKPPSPSQPETTKFNFRDFRITSVQYSINQSVQLKEGQTVEISTNMAVQPHYDQKTRVLSLVMGIQQTNQSSPFLFEVQGAASFQFESEPSQRFLDLLSNVNCPAIMFPYMREFIAELTRRGGFAPFHLPPVNFVKVAEDRKRLQEEQQKQEQKQEQQKQEQKL
mgnify:CR=1 FL=1